MDLHSIFILIELFILTGTGVVVVFGFFYSRNQFRLLRASHYIERFNSKDMVETRTIVDAWLLGISKLTPEQREQRVKDLRQSDKREDVSLKNQIALLLNLFTEMAIAYRRGALDEASTESFSFIIPHYLDELSFYIQIVQEEAYPRAVYANLEYLSEIFANQKPSQVAQAKLERLQQSRRDSKG